MDESVARTRRMRNIRELRIETRRVAFSIVCQYTETVHRWRASGSRVFDKKDEQIPELRKVYLL